MSYSECAEKIKKIANNMKDYDQVVRMVTDEKNCRTINGIKYSEWEPTSLSHGLPGLCLLYSRLHKLFPDEGWDRITHQYLSTLVTHINKEGIPGLSMFSGASGIGLAVVSASNGFRNYNKLLNTINDYICNRFEEYLKTLDYSQGTHSFTFDVIEGLSGIMSYLMIYIKQKSMHKYILQGLKKLIELTQVITVNEREIPGWYITAENQFSEQEQQIYPKGNFNTSLSHGVAGPLVILSKAYMEGVVVSGHEEAISRIVKFYQDFRSNDGKRDFWKGQLSLNEVVEGEVSNENVIRRDAWCYGTPGICYALICAGTALKRSDWVSYGVDTLKKAVVDLRGLYSPTFCHGFAGIIQLLRSTEELLEVPIFTNEINQLQEKTLSYYEESNIFGFKNMEYDETENMIRPYNAVGLLDGCVGTCLVLLGEDKENFWEKAFLL